MDRQGYRYGYTSTGTTKNPSAIKGFLGSARLPNARTPYLRLRLSVIIWRVQRGEAKLAVNVVKLGEYLALAPEDIYRLNPLLPGPLPERARPMRKRIDYVALRTQYEQLLLDGTCATKADVA